MEFKVFIKKNPLARKVFGKGEIVIIQKQIGGVNLTQSERNRLSRDIRPKLRFILEASRFGDEFGLKKGIENKRMVEEALEAIKEDKDFGKIKEVWLFGSMVSNQMSIRSDVDIAVLFDKVSRMNADKFRIRIIGRVHDKIDIQVFDVLPAKIKKSILKSHKVLYRR